MALLDDMGSVNYGTVPIIKIISDGTEVWPKVPVGLTAVVVDWDTINLTITPPAIAVDNYVIKRDGAQIYSGTALTFTDTSLSPSTAYTYTVDAMKGPTVTSSASASASTPGRADMGLYGSSPRWDLIDLAWSDPSGKVTEYHLYRNGVASPIYIGPGKSFQDSLLNQSAWYGYTLYAVRSGVAVGAADYVDVATAAHGDLGLRSDGTATPVKLRWSDTTQGSIDYYKLWRGSTLVDENWASDKAHDDRPGKGTYTYTLRAYRGGVEIGPADTLSVTVPARAYSSWGQNMGDPGCGGIGYRSSTVSNCNRLWPQSKSGYITSFNLHVGGYGQTGYYDPWIDGTRVGGRTVPNGAPAFKGVTVSTPGNTGVDQKWWKAAGDHNYGGQMSGWSAYYTQWSARYGSYDWKISVCVGTVNGWYWTNLERDEELRTTQPWWNESLAGRDIHIESWMDANDVEIGVQVTDPATGEILLEWGSIPAGWIPFEVEDSAESGE